MIGYILAMLFGGAISAFMLCLFIGTGIQKSKREEEFWRRMGK